MAQWWSDLLDDLRSGTTVLPFPSIMVG